MGELAPQNGSVYGKEYCVSNITPLDLCKVLHMNSGDGEASYALNSRRQGSVFTAVQPVFYELILQSLHFKKLPDLLRIADLGCATGMNAVSEVDFVLRSVQTVCERRAVPMPEMQVFYNDLPSNDFNVLFRAVSKNNNNYFAAGVPGSFYNVLFPRSSIDICVCVMALHWLSQVPTMVEREESSACNRGKVWINGSESAEVVKAYAQQSQDDLRQFFRSRAHEMASGGVMFVCAMGRPNSNPARQQVSAQGEYCGADFEAAWDDLISEGIVKPEIRDSFNLPWYFPNADEMREAIEASCAFEIKNLEVVSGVACMSEEEFDEWVSDGKSFGKKKSNLVRSFVGSIVEEKIGIVNADALFDRLEKRASELLVKGMISPSRHVTCTLTTLIRM